MGIKANFKGSDIEKRFGAFLDEIEKKQIARLQRLGEMCVTHARSIPKETGFEDQTGNLRSSIGYVVFKDGEAIHSMYEPFGGSTSGEEGAKAGEALAMKVGSEKAEGVCLVVTAGMNYAVRLEAKKRDVITSAEILAKRELPIMLEKLVNNIKKAAE